MTIAAPCVPALPSSAGADWVWMLADITPRLDIHGIKATVAILEQSMMRSLQLIALEQMIAKVESMGPDSTPLLLNALMLRTKAQIAEQNLLRDMCNLR